MYNRIQKLLLTEYKDFSETIFIESSFAEVDSKGNGIHQIQLGLSETNLFIAIDQLPSGDTSLMRYNIHADPEIECFELVNIIPLEFCQLKLCARYQRNFILVTVENGKKLFFEFGEHLMRSFFYNIWSDRIFYMNNCKHISYSTTTIDSIGNDSEIDIQNGNVHSLQLIHKNSNFAMNQSSIFGFVRSPTKVPKCEKDHKTHQEVHTLKRRIHKLNFSIKKQLEAMMNGETPEEATHLLNENKQELARIHNVTGEVPTRKKPVIEIYKKPSPRQSINSIENIWL